MTTKKAPSGGLDELLAEKLPERVLNDIDQMQVTLTLGEVKALDHKRAPFRVTASPLGIRVECDFRITLKRFLIFLSGSGILGTITHYILSKL
jgi:hypothetical protein